MIRTAAFAAFLAAVLLGSGILVGVLACLPAASHAGAGSALATQIVSVIR
jgi:hypothetical protein